MIEFIAKYYQIISVVFGFLAGLGIVIGIVYKLTMLNEARLKVKRDYKRCIESSLADLDKRMYNLDNPDGRINKLSDLCQSQIKSNKLALSNAAYVKGIIDEKKNNTSRA